MKKAWAWFDGLHWIPKLIIIFVFLGGISNAMGSNDTADNQQASISTTTSTTIGAKKTPVKATTTTEAAKSAIQTIEAKVIRVVDGDTIEVEMDGKTEKVRFIGVDTPETKHPSKPVEAYGKEASAYTESKLAGKTVFLELDVQERDKYGRVLAYVWLEDPTEISDAEVRAKMFNAHLLLNGYAQLLTIPPDVKYSNEYFVKYQTEARDNDKGLWAIVVTTMTTEKLVITTTTEKQAPAAATFIGSVNSDKYHYPWCASAKQIKPENEVWFSSAVDAQNNGYVPCKRCNPPR